LAVDGFPLPQHAAEFAVLAAHLRERSEQPIVFCPSPGNWGDSLINAGSREFFRSNSIPYREVRRENIEQVPNLDQKHVVLGGGGGWCEFWHTTPELVLELLPRVGHLTVLPTTFSTVPLEVPQSEKLTLFARDKSSSLEFRPDSVFCHDMAFHCSDGRGVMTRDGGTLFAFRGDKEAKTEGGLPSGNWDISLDGKGHDDPRPFYNELSNYSVVFSDRLHVAIASAQLGLCVHLFRSAYPKIELVYNSSLESTFPLVTLEKDEDRPHG
jgi:exopolysaccharide biosynthesis predicted pyruvyltransferase EpsI